MTLEQSDIENLLDAISIGEGTDLVRQLAQWALQQLIDAEATEQIGAGPWERSVDRSTHRNGSRQRLPRIITRRSTGPLFIGDRRPGPARTPAEADLCPNTGRARLSYRQAEQLFANATTRTDGGHYTLHQLRHSRLTHLAEEGEEVAMIKAKSRHRSLRSLERYLNPSPEAVRAMTNKHDPNRRNR